ncbi:MAG: 50S ribosomal protein L9 [Flavobacteriaceae bacterium]|nr:50S ribosomal protein L9 [Flavobacteriaceae bacterium]OUX40546.1 MAG: 50S ribosomal protein L9 [Flavobacteriaceae bacterium TMED265]
MEIILKSDVQNLGFKDDIVEVKNGYGRNFLIPQGLAVLATASAKKVHAENLKQRAHKEAKIIADAQEVANRINQLSLKIFAKVGTGDKLFGSVSSIDLAEALSKHNEIVDKKYILVQGGSVKRTGSYTAQVRLHREVMASLNFEVVPEAK